MNTTSAFMLGMATQIMLLFVVNALSGTFPDKRTLFISAILWIVAAFAWGNLK